jgi:DNA-binding MarR family transcriptional regulator
VAVIDKIIHERARLLILTCLSSSEKRAVSFIELQEKLEFTPGNLSVQLKRLKEADYVRIQKTFKDNKPHTSVSITTVGKKALNRYLDEMEDLIKRLRQ